MKDVCLSEDNIASSQRSGHPLYLLPLRDRPVLVGPHHDLESLQTGLKKLLPKSGKSVGTKALLLETDLWPA